ncbi:hypothetical protein T484DRAFT_1837627 [Baffinella frigidus]|nr:hypothetical protein T484DRAFT_1837627 [Cryptophyta sp. CCMP2293]
MLVCAADTGGRIDAKPSFVTPSPMHYYVTPLENTIKPRSPSYTLGPRLEYNPKSNLTPGPAAYEPAYTFHKF